jgi:hypothetical protein
VNLTDITGRLDETTDAAHRALHRLDRLWSQLPAELAR